MIPSNDELRWAYLDGELSPSEAANLDEALPPKDRERLAGEMRLETAIANVLSDGVTCPRKSWKSACAAVRKGAETTVASRRSASERTVHDTPAKRPVFRFRWWAAAAASGCLVAVTAAIAFFLPNSHPKADFLVLHEQGLDALAACAQVADGLSAVRAFIDTTALDVTLDPLDSLEAEESPYHLLGAREDLYQGEPIVQLLFECSGAPAKVVLVPGAGMAAKEIGYAVGAGHIGVCRRIGNALVTVVGPDAPRDLVRLIGERSTAIPQTDVLPVLEESREAQTEDVLNTVPGEEVPQVEPDTTSDAPMPETYDQLPAPDGEGIASVV